MQKLEELAIENVIKCLNDKNYMQKGEGESEPKG